MVKPGLRTEPFCSANDIAEFLSVSKSWVYRAAEHGDLPAYRIGGLIRFRLSEIAETLRFGRNDLP